MRFLDGRLMGPGLSGMGILRRARKAKIEVRVLKGVTVVAYRCQCQNERMETEMKCGCVLTVNGHIVRREEDLIWRRGKAL